jgi:2-polyprenyl-6-methoxyphenol hydroxylase-like FAD-dependent oxidoreductase
VSQLNLRVLVIGGDLGGLCLAQGLRRAGISVAVYERDSSPVARTQGYRFHMDARGEQALRECRTSCCCCWCRSRTRPESESS